MNVIYSNKLVESMHPDGNGLLGSEEFVGWIYGERDQRGEKD